MHLRIDMLCPLVTRQRVQISRAAVTARPIVLVVVRYSSACRQALELAARLAGGLGGELLVLALIPIGVRAMGTASMRVNDRKPSELARLETFVTEALGARPAVPHEPAIAFALSAHQHVAEISASRKPDLIVVGDPRGPMRRRLFGGLVNRIRATAPCPVVVVNRGARSALLTTVRRLAPAILRPQPAAAVRSVSYSSSPP